MIKAQLIEQLEAATGDYLNAVKNKAPLTSEEAQLFQELADACEDFLINYIYYSSEDA